MRFTAAFIAAAAPCIVSATVYLDWSFSQFPADGLQDVTFPFSMAAAKHEEGYYFAQQFNFNGIEAVSYAGVQPRPDRNGQSIVHATFSTFQDGATTAHPNCYPGADGEAPGASCALDVPGDYAHTWNVTVFKVNGTTWKGVLVDADTGESHEIGTWTLPSGAGSMQAQRDGFIEYYLSNAPGGPSCPKLPFTNVTYLNPTSNTAGASGGVLGKPYETGDCNGQADFAAKEASDGLNMVYGKFGKPQKQQDPDSIVFCKDTVAAKAKPTSAVASEPSCELEPPNCDAGKVFLDGECVIQNCGAGKDFVDGECIDQFCPAGQVRLDGECVEKGCDAGKVRLDGDCVDQGKVEN